MADKASRKSGGNQPISRHPLFPAIVALWFGALFGLVSIVIEPAFVEHVVLATGIDSLVPMAAPPLGATARILITLAMTGAGGVLGLLIARRIARPETETPVRRRDAASIATNDAPVQAAMHGSDDGVPAILPPPREQPAHEVDQMEARKSLAAGESPILDVSEFEVASFDAPDDFAIEALAPVIERDPDGESLFDAYSRQITERPSAAEEDNGGPTAPLAVAAEEQESPEEEEYFDDPLAGSHDGGLPECMESNAAHRIATAELDALSQVELLERLALAIARHRAEAVYAASVPEISEVPAEPEPEPQGEYLSAHEVEPEPQVALEPEYEPLAPPPVLPRLGARAGFDTRAESHEESQAESEIHEITPELPRVPAALRPVGHQFSNEDDALPGYVPPRHISLALEPSAQISANSAEIVHADDAYEDESEEDQDEALEEGYSSLLNLSRPVAVRQPFIRIDEPEDEEGIQPVVIFPGEEAPSAPVQARRPFDAPDGHDTEETEKALRAALATLKRMSGAA